MVKFLKRLFRYRYRVVADRWCGYESQVWRPWLPVWLQCFGCNTSKTVEEAVEVCHRHHRVATVDVE